MNQGLRLDTKAFRLLKNTFVKGGLRLLVPAVMERELLRHYRTRAEECAQAIKKTKAMHPLPVLEMLTPRPRNEVIDACFNRLESEWAYSFTVHPALAGNISRRKPNCGSRPVHPALAGNIRCQPHPQGQPPVHPRARGEHLEGRGSVHTPFGSSPRSRGTFCIPLNDPFVIRFIPALAGNIVIGLVLGGVPAVHPRARGEHFAYRRMIHL